MFGKVAEFTGVLACARVLGVRFLHNIFKCGWGHLVLLKGERNTMKTNRIVAFRLIALLMLTALAIIPILPGGASPAWDWIPGRVHYHCQEGSNRTTYICTWPTDAEIMETISFYGCQQYYDMVFSAPDPAGNVTVTVPAGNYYSEPFYEKPIGPFHLWLQVYLPEDGTGTLATQPNSIDVDVSMTVTGDTGAGNFTTDITFGDDTKDPAGSLLLEMPLNMSVWLGTSNTDPWVGVVPLFEMEFPMWVTTGFIEINIVDATPYPNETEAKAFDPEYNASLSMDGYYMSATGVPFDAEAGAALLAGGGAGLDVWAIIPGIGDAFSDYIFIDFEVIEVAERGVGGFWIPVDKLALLAPYLALVSTIILAVAATAILFKHRKKS